MQDFKLAVYFNDVLTIHSNNYNVICKTCRKIVICSFISTVGAERFIKFQLLFRTKTFFQGQMCQLNFKSFKLKSVKTSAALIMVY